MNIKIHQLPISLQTLLLTLYIFLVNSYALFSLYPSLKVTGHVSHFTTIGIYLILISPLLLYVFNKHFIFKNKKTFIIGASILSLALVGQYLANVNSFFLLIHSAVIYAITGFTEEFLWRCVLWNRIQKLTNSKLKTLILITLHFMILHIPFALLRKDAALLFLVQVFILGLVLGAVRIYTKGIAVPAWLHAIINMISYT